MTKKLTWGKPIIIPNNNGDTWDPAWAPDGSLYCASNDTDGFDKIGSKGVYNKVEGNNVMFNVITGDDSDSLKGTTVNTMNEYGKLAEKLEDNCTWKTAGTVSVNGILYQAIGRHCYGFESGDPYKRQTTAAASIMKSADGGKTWNTTPEEMYKNPQFKNYFTTPYFIYYGCDGDASMAPKEHEADKYVYAISNNGFWDSGDFYILGRIPKDKLPDLNPDDWEFMTDKKDGFPVWGKSPENAYKIIEKERGCGESGATYIPSIGKYMLVAWSYTENARDLPSDSVFDVYIADAPWGEWEHIGRKSNNPEGYYCPRVIAKFQESDNDKTRVYVCTAGDYTTGYGQCDINYYMMTLLPLDIELDTE